MATMLLLGFLTLLLLSAVWFIVTEMGKPAEENKVMLVFMENNQEISEGVLRQLCRDARGCKGGVYLLVIDNYSKDATVEIIRRMERYFPAISLVARNDTQSLTLWQLKLLLENPCGVLDLRDTPAKSIRFTPRPNSYFASLLV